MNANADLSNELAFAERAPLMLRARAVEKTFTLHRQEHVAALHVRQLLAHAWHGCHPR
jgi:hypothetical protein